MSWTKDYDIERASKNKGVKGKWLPLKGSQETAECIQWGHGDTVSKTWTEENCRRGNPVFSAVSKNNK